MNHMFRHVFSELHHLVQTVNSRHFQGAVHNTQLEGKRCINPFLNQFKKPDQ